MGKLDRVPHDHDDHKPKHKPGGRGPKEREIAAELTIAILQAAKLPTGDLDAIAERTAEVFRKMLALVERPDPRERESAI